MLKFTSKKRKETANAGPVEDYLELGYLLRCKARQRVRLVGGAEAGLFLPRGTVLRDGDVLESEEGVRVGVKSASETVSVCRAENPTLLARIAYHLGNRHAPVQIDQGRICWLHDHVLDDMARLLGGEVTTENRAFEPEEGAYAAGGHQH